MTISDWIPTGIKGYADLTWPELFFDHLNFFYHALQFSQLQGRVREQARIVGFRSRHILPPPGRFRHHVFAFATEEDGTFESISIVPKNRPEKAKVKRGSSVTLLRELDASVVREFTERKERGCKRMSLGLKRWMFPEANGQPDKADMEAYFEAAPNFNHAKAQLMGKRHSIGVIEI